MTITTSNCETEKSTKVSEGEMSLFLLDKLWYKCEVPQILKNYGK